VAQQKVSMVITDEQEHIARNALAQAEAALAGLMVLEPAERSTLLHLGAKSDPFARGVVHLLEQRPDIVPASLDLVEAQADIDARDALLPLQDTLRRLVSRIDDTVELLGHDIMAVALEGYGLLKVCGGDHGLEPLRKELGVRFAQTRRKSVGEQANACVSACRSSSLPVIGPSQSRAAFSRPIHPNSA
jgi:hypothetical protein